MSGVSAATKTSSPETIPFPESGYLSHAEYDPSSLVLTVGFKYGGERQFRPVYPQTWLDFKLSPSKGKFFHAAIRSTMGAGMRIK